MTNRTIKLLLALAIFSVATAAQAQQNADRFDSDTKSVNFSDYFDNDTDMGINRFQSHADQANATWVKLALIYGIEKGVKSKKFNLIPAETSLAYMAQNYEKDLFPLLPNQLLVDEIQSKLDAQKVFSDAYADAILNVKVAEQTYNSQLALVRKLENQSKYDIFHVIFNRATKKPGELTADELLIKTETTKLKRYAKKLQEYRDVLVNNKKVVGNFQNEINQLRDQLETAKQKILIEEIQPYRNGFKLAVNDAVRTPKIIALAKKMDRIRTFRRVVNGIEIFIVVDLVAGAYSAYHGDYSKNIFPAVSWTQYGLARASEWISSKPAK